MAFQKYVGFVSGAVQKYIENNLGKCPFCGEVPGWAADPQEGLSSHYRFRCSKCGGVLSVPTYAIANPFKIMPENLSCEDCGSVNGNNLHTGTTYSVQFLIACALKLNETNRIRQEIAESRPAAPAPQPPLTQPKKRKTAKIALSCAALALLFALSCAALGVGVSRLRGTAPPASEITQEL